jgi:hypothetical protein
MAPSKTLQIPETLTLAHEAEYRHQQQSPGRDADTPPHPSIGDCLEMADKTVAAETLWSTERDYSHRPQPMLAAPARMPVTKFEAALSCIGVALVRSAPQRIRVAIPCLHAGGCHRPTAPPGAVVNGLSSNGAPGRRKAVPRFIGHFYQPNDPWGLGGPFNRSGAGDLAITSDPQKSGVAKSVVKIPAVLDGMDKAEALAFVSRLFGVPPVWWTHR